MQACNRDCVFQTSLPVLDNPYSQRLREMVDSFRAQRSRYMKVKVPLSCLCPNTCWFSVLVITMFITVEAVSRFVLTLVALHM